MGADNDIVERANATADYLQESAELMPESMCARAYRELREAAAEIVRLRGEVKKLAAAVPVPRDPKAHQWNDDGERCLICGDKDWMGGPCSGPIAPAEAKGDAETQADNRDAAGVDSEEDAYVIERMGKLLAEIAVIVNGPEPDMTRWSYHDLPEKVRVLKDTPAAVPAGEAVAWLASDGEAFTDKESADRHSKVWGVNPLLTPLYTTPPAPVQAAPQEGEAAYWERWHPTHGVVSVNREPLGESIVDNRWEDRPLYRANPSACALGAVRELVKVWRIAVNSASTTNKQDLRPERFIRELEAALHHRGDSQEVGRG